MLATIWILVVTVAFAVHLFVTVSRSGLLTLDSVFSLSIWILAIGTFTIVNPLDLVDQKYTYVVGLPTLLYYATSSTVAVLMYRDGKIRERRILFNSPGRVGYAILGISIFVTILYYQLVGYNVFTMGIRDLISDSGGQDYTSLRLEAYSGSTGYLYPGYVNQFKNSLLPALSIATIVYLFYRSHRYRYLIATGLTAVTLAGLLGTGQRSMMVLFGFLLMVFTYQLAPRRFFKRAVLVVLAIVPPLMFSTLLLGRSSADLEEAGGTLGKLGVLGYELFERVFYVQQWSGQMVFHFTEQQPIQMGSEWARGVLGILPGFKGTDLAHVVFYMIYGTTRGTATPSLWGSAHYNFGWVGTVVLPIVLAIVYQLITTSFARKQEVTLLQVVSYSGFVAVAGNWIAGGPEYLLNAGAVTFSILYLIATLQKNRSVGSTKRAAFFTLSPAGRVKAVPQAPNGAG